MIINNIYNRKYKPIYKFKTCTNTFCNLFQSKFDSHVKKMFRHKNLFDA